jgi:hypothetical protein
MVKIRENPILPAICSVAFENFSGQKTRQILSFQMSPKSLLSDYKKVPNHGHLWGTPQKWP